MAQQIYFLQSFKEGFESYLGRVVALATGMEIALGSHVLSHIFKGMNDLITMKNGKLNRTARDQFRWLKFGYLHIFHKFLIGKPLSKFLLQ